MSTLKILLLGEFSGLHTNLAEGLRALGHSVTVASNGDSFKEISGDIALPANAYGSVLHRVVYRWQMFDASREFSGFDVVQLISPFIFPLTYYPFRRTIRQLRQRNGGLFLCAAGSDSYYWRYGPKVLRYGPWQDYLRYDLKRDRDPAQSDELMDHNRFVAKFADDVIPIMYDYQAPYACEFGERPIIPIPINTQRFRFEPRKPSTRVRFFHGISRRGFKGTRYILEAFDQLQRKYPNDLEFSSAGPMPMRDYIVEIPMHDVVVDQTSSYSHGLNGLISMAHGRTVLGGCEPESLAALQISESPAINITPDVQQIIGAVEQLLDQRSSLEARGQASREYIEKHHDFVNIANQYVARWRTCTMARVRDEDAAEARFE